MALTAEVAQKCPSGHGQTWRYKIAIKGHKNEWLDAGSGMEVICTPGNLN